MRGKKLANKTKQCTVAAHHIFLLALRIKDDSETGSIALSPILKRHNAYLVHNETLYCDETDVWRGNSPYALWHNLISA